MQMRKKSVTPAQHKTLYQPYNLANNICDDGSVKEKGESGKEEHHKKRYDDGHRDIIGNQAVGNVE